MSEINIQIGTTFNSFREISEKLLKDWSFSNYHVLKIVNSHILNHMDDETKNRISTMTFTLLVSIMGSQTVDIRLEIKG